MVKKIFSMFLSILMVSTIMVGCDSVSEGKKSNASSVKDDKATATVSSKKENENITVWCWDSFNIDAMTTAATMYKEVNPSVNINVEEKTSYDIQNLVETYATSGNLEDMPDIFLMDDQVFTKYLKNYPEVFSELTDTEIDFTQFNKSKLSNSMTDGKKYGIPYDSNTVIACYRTDYLEQAGYSITDVTDVTWDKFIEIGKDVVKKTGMPMLTNVQGEPDLLNMILQSAGVSVFDEKGEPDLINNEGLKVAIQVYMKLVKEGILVEQTDWAGYQDSINNGNVVGTINGSWICSTIMSTKDTKQEGKWAVTNMPSLNDYKDATNYSAQGGSTWAISSSCKNFETVVDFFATTWAGSTEFYDSILESLGAISTYLPASESEVYNQKVKYFNNEAIYSKIVDFGGKIPTINKGIYWTEEKQVLSSAISNVLNNKIELDEAIKEAQNSLIAIE